MTERDPWLDEVAAELGGRIDAILVALGPDPHPVAVAFFERIRRRLTSGHVEEHLAEAFMDLSMAAFELQGLALPPLVMFQLDQLLERAQEVAATLSADPSQAH